MSNVVTILTRRTSQYLTVYVGYLFFRAKKEKETRQMHRSEL